MKRKISKKINELNLLVQSYMSKLGELYEFYTRKEIAAGPLSELKIIKEEIEELHIFYIENLEEIDYDVKESFNQLVDNMQELLSGKLIDLDYGMKEVLEYYSIEEKVDYIPQFCFDYLESLN